MKIIHVFIILIGADTGKEPSNQYLSTVHTSTQQLYNVNHPLVEKFVRAGFPLEDSIFAVKHCNANEEAALDYLLSLNSNGALFSDIHHPFNAPESFNANTSNFQR